jgi:hypothetical protein
VEAEEPHRDEPMNIVISCWRALGTCRENGFGTGAIPWDAIDRWGRAKGFDAHARAVLETVIMKIDADWLAALAAKRRLQNAE